MRIRILAVISIALVASASCHTTRAEQPRIIQPGAPGSPNRTIAPGDAASPTVRYTAADVRFMQGMIGHHAQALDMTALVPSHSGRDDLRLLATRIEVSQADEIKMMQQWLTARGQSVPDVHAHHAAGATLMPGMLTPEEMNRLSAASGNEFDRLFLDGMIKHHEGALTMVSELLATPGAAQEPEMFAFASDVDSDQRAEIDRMRAMLRARGYVFRGD